MSGFPTSAPQFTSVGSHRVDPGKIEEGLSFASGRPTVGKEYVWLSMPANVAGIRSRRRIPSVSAVNATISKRLLHHSHISQLLDFTSFLHFSKDEALSAVSGQRLIRGAPDSAVRDDHYFTECPKWCRHRGGGEMRARTMELLSAMTRFGALHDALKLTAE